MTPSPRGTSLLLLHGVGATGEVWTPVVPYLEPHHDVLVPSLPGHGGGPRLEPGAAPTLESVVDGVERMLEAAGLDQVHVVGNSLGGWVALELARRGRARSVVVFSPAGAWRSQWRINAVATVLRGSAVVSQRLAGRAEALAARRWLRRLFLWAQVAHPDRVPPEVLAATIRAAADAPVVVPLLRVLPRRKLEPLPASRDYSVRIVWPQTDRVIPFRHFGAPMLDRVPGAELVRVAGIGHVPTYDDPALVARLILDITRAVGRS